MQDYLKYAIQIRHIEPVSIFYMEPGSIPDMKPHWSFDISRAHYVFEAELFLNQFVCLCGHSKLKKTYITLSG